MAGAHEAVGSTLGATPVPETSPYGPLGLRPRFRGRLHQIAFFASIPAGVVLIAMAPSGSPRVGALVYACSLTALYATSASYHRLARSVRARQVLRRLDHSMIYVLIAGTGTPVCLTALHGAWRSAGLTTLWVGATTGIVVKLFGPLHGWLGSALYIALGWAALLALPQLVPALGVAPIALMLAGGLLYTTGAVILTRRRPDPVPAVFGYHEVWHALVVAAGACHWAMVLLVVRAARS